MITVKNLHKSFHGTDVLKGINETIHKGEKVVVIGPSGSGKIYLSALLESIGDSHGRRGMGRRQ